MSDEYVGIVELRKQIGTRVDAAYFSGDITVITKNDTPRAAIVPHRYAQYITSDNGALARAIAVFFEDWREADSWEEVDAAVNKLKDAASRTPAEARRLEMVEERPS